VQFAVPRSNKTHASTTDPDAKLYRKGDGHESRLCYIGHVLMENRNGLAVADDVTQASGTAERDTALALIDGHRPGRRRITVGGDKGFLWDRDYLDPSWTVKCALSL
jgi:hypothetical protein